MKRTIVVAGATGLMGTLVCAELERRGQDVRRIARSLGVDLVTGTGLDHAMDGSDRLIDVSNVVTSGRGQSVAFFRAASTQLVAACLRHRLDRYVLLSIVGVGRITSGYYAGKVVQERIVRQSAIESSILRATQFHEFGQQMLARMAFGPVAVAPAMQCAPVAAVEVARHLVRLALEEEVTPLAELGGPTVHGLPSMMREVSRAQGRRRLVLPLPMPGADGRLMREGGLLPAPDAERGQQSFEAWLADVQT